MKCLDTYALVEIAKANPNYAYLIQEDIVIPDVTLAEFYWVLLRDFGVDTAQEWFEKLLPYAKDARVEILIAAMDYRYEERKHNLSFFDCAGYVYALTHHIPFVTGDKEFEKKHGVEFVK